MKYLVHIIILSSVLAVPLSGNAQKSTGEFEVGMGMKYSAGVVSDRDTGLNFHVYYSTTDNLRFGLNYTYYITREINYITPSAHDYNMEGHYHLINRDRLRLYTLLGISYSVFNYQTGESGFYSLHEEKDVGVNAGGGIELHIEHITFFTEPKFTMGSLNHFNITAGARLFFTELQ